MAAFVHSFLELRQPMYIVNLTGSVNMGFVTMATMMLPNSVN